MVRHIAMFHLTEAADRDGRIEVFRSMQASVDNMNGKVPGLIRAELGLSFSGGPHDIVMYCEFEDAEACREFANNPLHVAHREKMKEYVSDRVWADYEIN